MTGRRCTIRDDNRARVPFALVGVLLLVASATLTATLQPERLTTDPAVDVVMERASAQSRTALRGAVRQAGHLAAREPITVRANTTAGRVLNESTPFRDALRVRIYLTLRQRLDDLTARNDDVTGTASVPATPNASALRRAKRRVHIADTGPNRTQLRVSVENVSVTARRGDRVVGQRRTDQTVVVRLPVLPLHERVERFERRLNTRNPVQQGLGRRVTTSSYALAWSRGYAQYAGLPIENVVGNRHLELFTNVALMREQVATFGRYDPEARAGATMALAEVGLADLTAMGANSRTDIVGQLHQSGPLEPGTGNRTVPSVVGQPGQAPESNRTGPSDTMRFGVNDTATYAFAEVVDDTRYPDVPGPRADPRRLSTILDRTYSADVRLRADVRQVSGNEPGAPPEPPGDWNLQRETNRTRTTVSNASLGFSPTSGRWHTLAWYPRTVTRNHTRVRTWSRPNETRTTNTTATERYEVDLRLEGHHAPSQLVPDRRIEGVHHAALSPLDGRHLSGVRRDAIDRVVSSREGGSDALAVDAVEGDLGTRNWTVLGEQPTGIRPWVYRNLTDFREHLANLSVRVQRGEAGTHEVNPPRELARRLVENRSRLLDVPSTYRSVPEKAVYAARAALFERVVRRLRERAERRASQRTGLGEELDSFGSSLDQLERGLDGQQQSAGLDLPEAQTRQSGVVASVDGAPSYLTLSAVSHEQVPAVSRDSRVYPLAARNQNVFTLPTSDATNAVMAAITDERVPLQTAARTLRAANRAGDNESLAENRSELRQAVNGSIEHVRGHLSESLTDTLEGVEQEDTSATVVTTGLAQWDTVAGRALALSNGSAVEPVVRAADSRHDLNETERDQLEIELRMELYAALDDSEAKVPRGLVNETSTRNRRLTHRAAAAMVNQGLDAASDAALNRLGRRMNVVPAGMPVSLVPSQWYMTMNVWLIEVRGTYARFTVRTQRGTPASPDGSLSYVRDGSTVTIDYDGDGRAERFGRADRVNFSVGTTVVVVVPPGRGGVGDKNGDMDERSQGWGRWMERGGPPRPDDRTGGE
jgi:hypothetical protein